jgi:hypothetical protein
MIIFTLKISTALAWEKFREINLADENILPARENINKVLLHTKT